MVALALVVTAAWSVELAEKRIRLAGQQSMVDEIASSLERQAAADEAYLEAMGAVFANAGSPSPQIFRNYVQRLHVLERVRGVIGLGWVQIVEQRDLPALRRQMVAGGHADFRLRPFARPTEWPAFVVTMLEPRSAENGQLIGFDMRSEARRAAAIARARRTDAVAATDPTKLIQDNALAHSPGFLVFAPVRSLTDERLRGLVYLPVRTGDFVTAAVRSELLESGRIELVDGTPDGEEVIFRASPAEAEKFGSTLEEHVEVFDQQWTLRYAPVADETFYPLSVIVLFGGTAFSLLLVAYFLLVQRRNNDLQALLETQTVQEKERAAFVRELNHRVKNSLANVTSIISLTRHSTDDVNAFAETLLQRVRALAAGHSLLAGGQWTPTSLRSIVATQLEPHGRAEHHIVMEGPEVMVSPNDALTVGLAFHELATNAMRYGALSTDEGQVTVRWQIADDNWVQVEWIEEGGPPVTPPEANGFGLNLVQRALAHELRRPIEIDFDPRGLRCRFFIQLRQPRSFQLRN